MLNNVFYAQPMAEVFEAIESQPGVDFVSAYIMCDAVLTEVSNGAIRISPLDVPEIIREVKRRLGLAEDKGGAR